MRAEGAEEEALGVRGRFCRRALSRSSVKRRSAIRSSGADGSWPPVRSERRSRADQSWSAMEVKAAGSSSGVRLRRDVGGRGSGGAVSSGVGGDSSGESAGILRRGTLRLRSFLHAAVPTIFARPRIFRFRRLADSPCESRSTGYLVVYSTGELTYHLHLNVIQRKGLQFTPFFDMHGWTRCTTQKCFSLFYFNRFISPNKCRE